jgi:haloalkane dehalogenase
MELIRPMPTWDLLEAHAALSRSSYPKLLFVGDPGVLVSPAFAEEFAKRLRNCRVVHSVPGAHYLQEDHPQTIGAHIRQWLTELGVPDQTKELF